MNDLKNKFKCFACDDNNEPSQGVKYTPATINKLKVFDEMDILTCHRCGFSFASEVISDSDLKLYYEKSYTGRAKKVENIYSKYIYSDNFIDNRAVSQLSLLLTYIELNESSRVLEIGSGNGAFLYTIKRIVGCEEIWSVEPQKFVNPGLKELKVNIINDSIKNIDERKFKEKFDLVIMSHTLEHFNACDIDDLLIKIKSILKKDGHFFCEIPNADIKKYPNAGECVVPHLSFFSEKAIRYFLEKSNFTVQFINCAGNYQHEKELDQEIKKYNKLGFYYYYEDDDGVLVNKKNMEHLLTIQDRQNKINLIINIFRKIFGEKITMYLYDLRRKLLAPSLITLHSDPMFKYGKDREFIRVISKRN